MKRPLLAALCVIVALTSTACGGGQHHVSGASAATASLKAELLRQSASKASPFTFSDTQAQCTASRIVSAVGTSSLQQYGLLTSANQTTSKTLNDTTLSAKDAGSVVNAIIDCLGEANVTEALTAAVSRSLKGARTAAQRACLTSKLTIAALRPMLIDTLSGNQATAQAFYRGLASCIPS
ncbi:MAG: hypothetical protein ACTHOG_04850 [Marmoricola sp.]